MQQRLEERIVGAAEHHGVGVVEAVGESFRQIDAGDLLGDGVVHPAFLHERDQQRAGLLAGFETQFLESFAVGVAADGGFGSDDHNLPIPRGRGSSFGPRLNHSDHGYVGCGADSVKGERGRGVAGDDQHLGALGL